MLAADQITRRCTGKALNGCTVTAIQQGSKMATYGGGGAIQMDYLTGLEPGAIESLGC